MAESLKIDQALTTYSGLPTLAEGLEGSVAQRTFEIARRHRLKMFLTSESAIERAIVDAYLKLGLVLEASAAVALACATEHLGELSEPTVIVLTGSNIDPETLSQLLRPSPVSV